MYTQPWNFRQAARTIDMMYLSKILVVVVGVIVASNSYEKKLKNDQDRKHKNTGKKSN